MIMPSDARQRIHSLIDLLRENAGMEIEAQIVYMNANGNSQRPEILVEFTGSDTSLLTSRNGELLHAIEHLAAKFLGLEPEEHDRISFDADNFKVARNRELHRLAYAAIVSVRTTATAYIFPPMMSRERRLLHLALAESGMKSASIGERFHRSVVLYPMGVQPPPARPDQPFRGSARPR